MENPQIFYPIREDTLKDVKEDIRILSVDGRDKDIQLEWVEEFEHWEDGGVKGMEAKDVVKKYSKKHEYHYFRTKSNIKKAGL